MEFFFIGMIGIIGKSHCIQTGLKGGHPVPYINQRIDSQP